VTHGKCKLTNMLS